MKNRGSRADRVPTQPADQARRGVEAVLEGPLLVTLTRGSTSTGEARESPSAVSSRECGTASCIVHGRFGDTPLSLFADQPVMELLPAGVGRAYVEWKSWRRGQ